MAGKVYEIAFKIAGQMSGGFSKSFATANKTVQKFGYSLNELNAKAHGLGKQVAEAKSQVDAYKDALAKTLSPTEEMVARTAEAEQRLKDLTVQYNKAEAAAERYRRGQEKIAKATELQNKMKGWASSSAMKLGAIGAAGAGVAAATIAPAMAMEDAMADVAKVTDFDPKGLKAAQEQLEKMSLKIPMSATGLAQIMASAAQSGVAKEELVAFTEQAAKMGVAFDISAEEAGTMMSKWRSGMGLTQDQVVSLADAANALSNENAATAAQIGDVLMRYGAMGKVAGLSEKQVAAFATTVIASGAESNVAATGIKAFMRQLGAGEKLSKKAQGYFSAVGLDPAELQKNLQKDAPAAIVSALEAIKKEVPKERWNEYLSAMFGEESAAAVGPMMANLDALKKNFKLVADESGYAGSMMKEFETRSKTTSNSLQLAKNAATVVAGNIGKALLPIVQQASKKFVEVGAKVAEWISKNQGLVLTVLKVVGAVVGFVAVFHALRIAFSLTAMPILSLYKGIVLLTSGIAKQKIMAIASTVATKAMAAAQWLMNTAILGCPIGWIIAGIVALIAVGVLLYKNWDTVKAKCVQLWAMFSEKFPNLAAIAKGAFNIVVTGAKWLWTGLKWAFGAIMAYLKVLWSFWSGVFSGIWNAMKVWFGGIKTVFMNVMTIIDNIIGFVKNVFTGQWSAAWENVKNIFGAIWGSLVAVVKTPINAVIALVNGAISGINNALSKVKIPDWVPGFGGKGFSFSIPKIPQLAEGGIATKPTMAMIGEGRESEAVLPLSKLKGMLGGGGGGISVNFAPVINVSGGGDAYAGVKRGLEEGAASLKRELEKLMMSERRLSYY